MRFDLGGAIVDINDDLDIATFAISEQELGISESEAFDASLNWPDVGVITPGAVIQLIGYPEDIRIIDPSDRSVIFQAWAALGYVEDISERDIIVVYDPAKAVPMRPPLGAARLPPLGYNMSGCSGGPAIIHETRNGLHRWYPVGLIVSGPKESEGAAAEFDIVRIGRIDCIDPSDGCIRVAQRGWLPSR